MTTASRKSGDSEEFWACAPNEKGRQVVICTISGELLRFLRPGVSGALAQLPALPVYVRVEPGVPTDSVRPNLVKVEGGGVATVEKETPTLLNPAAPLPFGLADFGSYLADAAGAPDTQAAGRPNSLTTSLDVVSAINRADGSSLLPTRPVQDLKDVVVDLPTGFVGDPQAAQQCPLHDLVATSESSGCPGASQVGRLSFNASSSYQGEYYKNGRQNIPVYNMVPEHGYPAEFGFLYAAAPLVMYASVVGNGAEAHVRVSIPGVPASQLVPLQGAEVTFFGDPAVQDGLPFSPVAFFTNPSDCSGKPLVTSIHIDSWQNPGARHSDGTPDFSEPAGSAWKSDKAETPPVEGCGALHFDPSISVTPDLAQAGAPTGLGVDLEVPQSSDPSIPATPDLKQVVVTLPAGMVLSPSAANGLGACSPAQIGLENNDTPSCPESSKIGTVRVKTPLLERELEGSVYLAQQGNGGPAQGSNPFGSLLAIYVVVEGSGVVVKLPGRVELGEPGVSNGLQPGQIRTTFDENPQLPFSDFKLHFESGPRAPLSNPSMCGTYTPQATLSSWSGQTVQSNRSFGVSQGENGAPCPGSVFVPSFTAGTSNNQAAAFSPLSVTFSRTDQDQTLGAITVQTPPGLLGKIAGIPLCPETQANAGTCGPESLIGHTTVGAGPGSDPFYVGGSVYLTGPYRGAPFGLSIVVPVVAGPFNLGTEVVRAAIAVDPHTAQITVTSNPLPTSKQGIPFQVRTVNVTIDRSGFMFNPTNCAAQRVDATITSTAGAGAGVASPFQAANCANLPFKPSFTASTQGKTSKAGGASLVVKVAQKPGEANIRKVDLTLPKILPARLTTLQKACTEAQFNTNPAGCPAASSIGTAKAVTPVLGVPLTGPAYLVSHGGAAFPDVEFVLQGEGVEIILDGGTDIKKGITYSRFETVPDAPISSFETNLPEGPHSALAANGNLCATAKTVTVRRRVTVRAQGRVKHIKKTVRETVAQLLTMPTTITGQNGAVLTQVTKIGVTGCSKAKKKAKKKAKGGNNNKAKGRKK
ncbi:MAG TPA: hypothetical protein VNY31_10775 [Solirubrobacteraceae bacterium]|nr:hypothetical protein [Solirubrobacteraceae bacterium]